MSKKGIIFMVGAAIAAGVAGYKVGTKKHYCCLCDGMEPEADEEIEEQADEDDVQTEDAETRRILTKQLLGEIRNNGKLPVFRKLDQKEMDELIGKVRPELLAYIMCCGSDN